MEGNASSRIPGRGASPSSAALGREGRCGIGLQAQAPLPRGQPGGWTRPGAPLAGAEPAAGRGAHDSGATLGGAAGPPRARPVAPRAQLRQVQGRGALGSLRASPAPRAAAPPLGRPMSPPPHPLTRGSRAFGLCVAHCRSSRRVGRGGRKVSPGWSGRGPVGRTLPAPHSAAGEAAAP